MKDGQIIQVGTPEELVIRPATDYVAEFTRDVQRAKVISAKALMRVPQPDAAYAGSVPADARVASFAAQIVGEGRPFAVADVDGTVIGRIERDDVVDVLAGRSRPR